MMDEITQQFADSVRQRLREHLKKIILFGSRARGDADEDSDYDILVVVDRLDKKTKEQVLDAGVEIMDEYYALIGSIVCDEEDWERKKYFPIGLNILEEGIEL